MIFPHEVLDLAILQKLDILHCMGGDEAVHADHHRQPNRLGNGERLDIVVIDLLVVLRINLNPARIPRAHGVGMVVIDVDGAGQRTGRNRQHNGKPAGRCHVQKLIHQRQTAGGGGTDGPSASRRGTDTDGHGAVLGFYGHQLGMYLAVRHVLGKILGNFRGGSDGECAHDVRVNLPHGHGNRFIAGKSVEMCHYSPSS